MNIPFRHLGKIPQPFEISKDDIHLSGTLLRKEGDLFLMQAHMNGKLSVFCDICAEQFDIMLDDEINLLLSDGIYRGSVSELDVVEMNGSVDMDELLHSEIGLVKSDYHRCELCKKQND